MQDLCMQLHVQLELIHTSTLQLLPSSCKCAQSLAVLVSLWPRAQKKQVLVLIKFHCRHKKALQCESSAFESSEVLWCHASKVPSPDIGGDHERVEHAGAAETLAALCVLVPLPGSCTQLPLQLHQLPAPRKLTSSAQRFRGKS